ncbi:TIGR01777 family oxidoreductase [Reichenbachiella sp. MALMAid0571]|uniref:TIGR01777 family oxidoreductase n=1 Tax=Reichenbachiella sp. MALMAid0571 TaxID=3143939 RepID=UPI0032DF8BD8
MNILITGGRGLVGSDLTQNLLNGDHKVRHLSRSKRAIDNIEVFEWDIEKGKMDQSAVENLDAIIHLAGESVADKKWSAKQKAKIISSRTDSARLLFDAVSKLKKKPSVFISASGVGYYGIDTKEELMTEESEKGDGFLSDVVEEWEKSVDKFSALGIRTVKLRIGLVLAKNGGALPKMALPVKFFIGSPLGTGKQQISWIHINDLVELINYAVYNKDIEGVYNAVSSDPVTNSEMTRSIANALGKPLFMPNVPSFVLKLLLGEMSVIVTGGNKVSNRKIKSTGFNFQNENLDETLSQILNDN